MARYQIVGMAGTSPAMTPNKWFNMTGTRSNSPSIPSIQEPSRDHLCLDLGRAFESQENARLAQYAGNLVLEGKPVAAMDLDRVVGGGPGDPCGQKLRHPCLEVAAAALVLFPRRVIADLACDHDLGRHHGDLVGNTGKRHELLAELDALVGISDGLFHGRLGDADRARRGLDAGRFEGLHDLLEALALDPAEPAFGLDLEAVERTFVFLHAALAQHLQFVA